ncbi:MAG: mercury methylation corrinoid protein HgcA [Desulfovibrionaceae bacterium]
MKLLPMADAAPQDKSKPCCDAGAATCRPAAACDCSPATTAASTCGNDEVPCCGARPGPRASAYERPGYAIRPYVDGFVPTPAGPVPRVRTALCPSDRLGTLGARIGCTRDDYRVAPGLYCLGNPTPDSPVIVTANYKLTFDTVRTALPGTDAWLLVLDTRGVNVWCAASKGTFGTGELASRVQQTRLDTVVRHRTLIVPQLGATGVAARAVKKACGFTVAWGPVRAADLPRFLANGHHADAAMRTVTFTLRERLALVPVELYLARKLALWLFLAAAILSAISPAPFSHETLRRCILLTTAGLGGLLAGNFAVPALLPWLPGRMFALKGAVIGLALGLVIALLPSSAATGLENLALPLVAAAAASYCGMNFTGSTPFTSPTGVEKEMRRWMPIQALAVLAAAILWAWAPFAA